MDYGKVINMLDAPLYLFDMDGVMAKWEENGDWHEKGFFLSRKREESVIELIKTMDAAGENVSILTAADGSQARIEKLEWLEKAGLSNISVIFVPFMSDKSEAVADIKGSKKVLIDDFSKNLFDWQKAGHTAVKFRNGINGTNGTWKGTSISNTMAVDEMYNILKSA